MMPVIGNLKIILRLEGLTILALSMIAFAHYSADWYMFIVLFLIPDLALIGYLKGNKTGAILYNVTHSLIIPILWITLCLLTKNKTNIAIGFIWAAHVGFDRALSFGLKYASGFKYTHLGKIGK